MNYIAIAGFIFAFALSAFGWNYRFTAANRIYLGLYKGVAEDSVITVDKEGRELPKPYISVSLFSANLDRYLKKNAGSLLNYSFMLYATDEGGRRVGESAYKIDALLTFKISLTKDYNRIAVFTIQEGRVN